jgi:uncharacterized membrane protein
MATACCDTPAPHARYVLNRGEKAMQIQGMDEAAARHRHGYVTSTVSSTVARNIDEIVELEGRDRKAMGLSDHFADLMTQFSGSMLFVWAHVVWFGIWIGLNEIGIVTFDAFPFGFLTMIVSLEAIFLSTFVLISQNRQALQADRRAKVDLQINMVAEQEITKLIALVADVHEHLGLHHEQDQELAEMKSDMHVTRLADAVDEAEAQTGGGDPKSAADTEH